MSSAPSDVGPVLPSKAVMFTVAKEIGTLASRAKVLADQGDVRGAMRNFDAIRATLGVKGADGHAPIPDWANGEMAHG